MATTTKATGGLAKKSRERGEGGAEWRNKTFDLSNGKVSLTMTIFQIFSLCIFIFGCAWFLASEWVFETKSERLRSDVLNDLTKCRNDFELKFNELKNKNTFLK